MPTGTGIQAVQHRRRIKSTMKATITSLKKITQYKHIFDDLF
jgi:hypothetical protein